MLNSLNVHVDLISLLWLLPICFLFHDFEEILTVEAWGVKHGRTIEARLPRAAGRMYRASLHMNTRSFAMDVLFVYILVVAVTVSAVFFTFYLLYLGVLTLFLLHVFTHVGQSLYLRMYTPGVVTALLIVFPYSTYAFYRLLHEGIVDGGEIARSLLLLLLLTPPLLFLLLRSRQHRSVSENISTD